MNSGSPLIEQLNPQYFWDVDINKLNHESGRRLIIERIFNFGKLSEIKLVIDFYGRDTVIDVVINLNYIDKKTFNFIAKLFRLPETKFRCQTQNQLKHPHWNS